MVMHPFYHNYLLPAVTCFIIASCTKNMNNNGMGPGTKPPPPVTTPVTPDSTVYIAGYNGANAILWKNGLADTLSTTLGIANQVLVSGTDVYVTGVYQGTLNTPPSNNNGGPQTGQYVYWKNGTPNNIDTVQIIGNSSGYFCFRHRCILCKREWLEKWGIGCISGEGISC